jgi:hypothetical protein
MHLIYTYNQINCVVRLDINYRNQEDKTYTNILERLRIGKMTEIDITYVNRKSFCETKELEIETEWCPIITSSNKLRQEANVLATIKFATNTNQPIHRIMANIQSQKGNKLNQTQR